MRQYDAKLLGGVMGGNNKLIYRLLLLVVFTNPFLVISCVNEIEESTTFYDTYTKEEVISQLKSQKVTFRITGNTIWYPLANSDVVKNVFDKVTSSRPIVYTFYKHKLKNEFVLLLRKNGIEDIIVKKDNGADIVLVKQKYRTEARRLFESLMK